MTTNKKDYLWHDSIGITCFAASPRHTRIAVGEEGQNPAVTVYRYPEKDVLYRIRAGAKLVYSLLAFTRDGDRLVTVSDYPDYKFKLWAPEGTNNLKEIVSVELEKEPLQFKSKDGFLLVFKHEVRLYRLHESFKVTSAVLSSENPIAESTRVSHDAFEVAEGLILDAIFDKYEHVYLTTTANQLFVLSPSLEKRHHISLEHAITAMALTHRFLVTATDDRKLQWLHVYIPPEVPDPRDAKNSSLNLKAAKELVFEELQQVGQITFNTRMDRILLTSRQGKIELLNYLAEPDYNEKEEEAEGDLDDEEEEEADAGNRKVKQVLAQPTVLGSFQIAPISCTVGLGDSSQCVSIAENMKVFDGVSGECLATYLPPEGVMFTALDSSLMGTTVFVGSSGGCIRVFDVTNRVVPRLITVQHLMNKPITVIQISPDQKIVAAASSESRKLWFLEAAASSRFRVLGFTKLPDKVRALAWHKRKVMVLAGPKLLLSVESPRHDLPPQLAPLTLARLYRYVAEGTCLAVYKNEAVVAGVDREILVYELPEQDLEQVEAEMKKVPPDPSDRWQHHELQTTSVCFSPDYKYLASGSVSGVVKVQDTSSKGNFMVKQAHGPGSVKHLAFSADSALLFSTGTMGNMFCWSTSGRTMDRPVPSSVQEDSTLAQFDVSEDIEDSGVPLFTALLTADIVLSERDEVRQKQETIRSSLASIQQRLNRMLDFNESAPDLEKLDRDEFVVDVKLKEDIEAAGHKAASELRQEIHKENQAQKILKDRIKQRTHESMEVHSKLLGCLATTNTVYNFGIRRFSPQELLNIKRARVIRVVELREQQGRKAKGQAELLGYPHLEASNYIINKSTEEWTSHPLLQALAKKKASDLKEGEEAEIPVWELLYPTWQLYTPTRKRTQAYLMQQLVRDLKEGFNLEFKKWEGLREKQLDLIHEKNVGMAEKLEKLRAPKDLFIPKTFILQTPAKVLEVIESEITVEKYLTREEREAAEELRRKEEERLKRLEADDAGRRALSQMMGGTLERKQDAYAALDEQLEREDWMKSTSLEDMTDEQRQKMKEFEEKEKKMAEEKEKQRKMLEGEVRRFRAEIKDICDKYDQKVKELFILRLTTEYQIFEQELTIIHLALSVREEQHRVEELQELRRQQADMQEVVHAEETEVDNLTSLIEIMEGRAKEKVSSAGDDERQLNKWATNSSLPVKALLQAMKKVDKKGPVSPDPALLERLNGLNPLDPFSEEEKAALMRLIPQAEPQDPDFTRDPINGVSEENFNKMLQYRKAFLGHHKEAEQTRKYIERVFLHKEYLRQKLEIDRKQFGLVSKSVEDLTEQVDKERFNIHLMVKLRQAIVEVPQQPVVTDYSDAILIKKEEIQIENDRIQEIGAQKVAKLEQICKDRIKSKMAKWEKVLLEIECEDLMESAKDVKMLRSDKHTQRILAGEGLHENKTMAIRLEKQIIALDENTGKRVELTRKKEKRLKEMIEKMTAQNEELENDVREMQVQNEQRKQLLTLKTSVSDHAKHDPARKFNQINTRRMLVDKAKQQHEEIEFLREELDRMRAKTFPSFTHFQAKLENPDEV